MINRCPARICKHVDHSRPRTAWVHANSPTLVMPRATPDQRSQVGAGDGLVQIVAANDTLFTSGTLGRYSKVLHDVVENHQAQPSNKEVMAD